MAWMAKLENLLEEAYWWSFSNLVLWFYWWKWEWDAFKFCSFGWLLVHLDGMLCICWPFSLGNYIYPLKTAFYLQLCTHSVGFFSAVHVFFRESFVYNEGWLVRGYPIVRQCCQTGALLCYCVVEFEQNIVVPWYAI